MRRALIFCVCVLSLLWGGCDPREAKSPFFALDITGPDYGRDLALTDHTGQARTLGDFKGRAVLVSFGFTHCPDVCPTSLAEMARAMKLLGSDANRVQVLFVTVDPERDTQALLAKFVPAFDPRFLGLRGDDAATRKAAQSFHVFYEKRPGKTPDSYGVDHFAQTFAFDPHGRLRLLFDYGTGAQEIAHDVRLLLS